LEIEEMPDDWDPEKEGFRPLTDEEQVRATYIMRHLMASGKYYPTNAETLSVKMSATVNEMVEKGIAEEKVDGDKRYLRLLRKGFVNPHGWDLLSPFKFIFWKVFMEEKAGEFEPLYKYVTDNRLIGGGNA